MEKADKVSKYTAAVSGPTISALEEHMLHGKRFHKYGHNYREQPLDDDCSLAESSLLTADTQMSRITSSSSSKLTGSLSWWIVSRRKQIIEANTIIDAEANYYQDQEDEQSGPGDYYDTSGSTGTLSNLISSSSDTLSSLVSSTVPGFRNTVEGLTSVAMISNSSSVPSSSVSGVRNTSARKLSNERETAMSWGRAVSRARMASILIQSRFRQTLAKKRVQCLAHERAMTWVIVRMIRRWVYKLRLRQKNATKLRACITIQRCYRGMKGREIALKRVMAGIKVNEAYCRFLQTSHLKLSLRRIERPLLITLRAVKNIRMADITGDKVKMRISIWWHNVLHTANSADVTAILETKKPHFVRDTALYNVSVTSSVNGEKLGEVVFNSKNIAASHNIFSGLTTGVSDVALNLTHGVSDVAYTLGNGVIGAGQTMAGVIGRSTTIGAAAMSPSPDGGGSTDRVGGGGSADRLGGGSAGIAGSGSADRTGAAVNWSASGPPSLNNSLKCAEDKDSSVSISQRQQNSRNSSTRQSGLNVLLLPSMRTEKVAKQEITFTVPACHGNCYIRFDLIDEPGRIVGFYSYAMPKHNRLMFWGTPKNEDGSPGIEKVALKFVRGVTNSAADTKAASRGSQHQTKVINMPKSNGLISGGRRLGTQRKLGNKQNDDDFPQLDMRVVRGVRSEWVIMQVSGAGPFARKQLQQQGVVSATMTLLANYGSNSQHKNYFRHLLSLLPDRLEFYKSKSSHEPEFEIDLTSVLSVEAEASNITCFASQIDPSVPTGDSGRPKRGTVHAKNVTDNYDIVMQLDTDDALYIRFMTPKSRRLWLATLIDTLEKNLNRIAREEAEAARIAAELLENDNKRAMAAKNQQFNLTTIGSNILRRASVSLGLTRRSPIEPPPITTGALVRSLSMKMFAIEDDESESSSSESSFSDPPPAQPMKYVRRMSTIDQNGIPALGPARNSLTPVSPGGIMRQSSMEKSPKTGGKARRSSLNGGKFPSLDHAATIKRSSSSRSEDMRPRIASSDSRDSRVSNDSRADELSVDSTGVSISKLAPLAASAPDLAPRVLLSGRSRDRSTSVPPKNGP